MGTKQGIERRTKKYTVVITIILIIGYMVVVFTPKEVAKKPLSPDLDIMVCLGVAILFLIVYYAGNKLIEYYVESEMMLAEQIAVEDSKLSIEQGQEVKHKNPDDFNTNLEKVGKFYAKFSDESHKIIVITFKYSGGEELEYEKLERGDLCNFYTFVD